MHHYSVHKITPFSDLQKLLPLFEQLGYPTTLKILQKRFKEFTAQKGNMVAVAFDEFHVIG